MTRTRNTLYLCIALLAAVVLTSCKPTENNYKAAYDAAQAKREKDASDPDIYIPGGQLVREGEPKEETIEGRKVLVMREPLKLIAGQAPLKRYNVAIAYYKMTANAQAHWERIKADYPEAVLTQNGKEIYSVCIGSFDSEAEAVTAYAAFEAKYPDMHYVGISGARPVLEIAHNVH